MKLAGEKHPNRLQGFNQWQNNVLTNCLANSSGCHINLAMRHLHYWETRQRHHLTHDQAVEHYALSANHIVHCLFSCSKEYLSYTQAAQRSSIFVLKGNFDFTTCNVNVPHLRHQ